MIYSDLHESKQVGGEFKREEEAADYVTVGLCAHYFLACWLKNEFPSDKSLMRTQTEQTVVSTRSLSQFHVIVFFKILTDV